MELAVESLGIMTLFFLPFRPHFAINQLHPPAGAFCKQSLHVRCRGEVPSAVFSVLLVDKAFYCRFYGRIKDDRYLS